MVIIMPKLIRHEVIYKKIKKVLQDPDFVKLCDCQKGEFCRLCDNPLKPIKEKVNETKIC